MLAAWLAYGTVMSVLTILRIPALKSYAWDLGAYSQAFSTTVHEGRFFYYTMDLPNNPSGSFFGAHFAPLLLLLLPLYSLAPAPPTLVCIQSWALATGSPLVFALSRRRHLSQGMAGVLALLYLANPALIGVNWFDFHLEAFLVPFILLACYFWERQGWVGFTIAIGLTLLTIEMAAVVTAVLGLFWACDCLVRFRNIGKATARIEFRASVAVIVVGLAWFWAGTRLVVLVNPANALLAGGTDFWSVLGAPSMLDVPLRALLAPQSLVAALTVDWPLKVGFLLVLLGSVAFLPLLRPLSLVLLLPWLGVAFTSNNPNFYTVGNQYPALVLPFLFYGAIMGLESLARRLQHESSGRITLDVPAVGTADRDRRRLYAIAMTIAVVLAVGIPLGELGIFRELSTSLPIVGEHEKAVLAIAAMVPPHASILTQNNLFPLFYDRSTSYVIPHSTYFPPGSSFNRTLRDYLNRSDYVLVDISTSELEAAVVLIQVRELQAFGVVASDGGAILLQRGFVGPPRLFVPMSSLFDQRNLILSSGGRAQDPGSDSGIVLIHRPGDGPGFWVGPGVVLWPGNYTVAFRLRANTALNETLLTLGVAVQPIEVHVVPTVSGGGVTSVRLTLVPYNQWTNLTSMRLSGTSFPSTTMYVQFMLSFSTTSFGLYHFTGQDPSSNTTLYLDRISLMENSALAYFLPA